VQAQKSRFDQRLFLQQPGCCLLVGDFQVEFAGFLDEADQGLNGLAHGECSFGNPEMHCKQGTAGISTPFIRVNN